MTESLNKDQYLIQKLTGIILSNIDKKEFGVSELVRESGMTRSRLNRKLISVLNKTIHQFIRETRLKKALEMLASEDLTASEVAYMTGFSSPAYFNVSFHQYFGYPPGKVSKAGLGNPEVIIPPNINSPNRIRTILIERLVLYRQWVLVTLLILSAVSIVVYRNVNRSQTIGDLRSKDGKISVAVMPFRNMTSDAVWNSWQYLIQEHLISYLSNYNSELKVWQSESVRTLLKNSDLKNFAQFTPTSAGIISQKLNTNVFIYGSIQRAGNRLQINAQVTNSKSELVIRSFEIYGVYDESVFFDIVDSLRILITNYLVISGLKEGIDPDYKIYEYTKSLEAYKLFISGNDAVMNGDQASSIQFYKQALKFDSNFVAPKIFMASSYMSLGKYSDSKKWCMDVYEKRDRIPLIYRNNINWLHAVLFETPHEAIRYLKEDLHYNDDWAVVYYLLGAMYNDLYLYEKAIPEFEKAFDIKKGWDVKPGFGEYTSLGLAYHMTGEYGKEARLYKKALRDYPENSGLSHRQAILALSLGDTTEANNYISKFISLQKENSSSEAAIATRLAGIYSDAGIPYKAEDYYREAVRMEPGNPLYINNLAYFLIDKNLDIDEGLELADSILNIKPDNFNFLHTKGWGLYKKGKYQEANEILRKSWDLRKERAIYNHTAFLHLEAAKQSVAGD
jgi:tetratricopeptide (TPR) repeat protein/AraC-like DNA-binding protein